MLQKNTKNDSTVATLDEETRDSIAQLLDREEM